VREREGGRARGRGCTGEGAQERVCKGREREREGAREGGGGREGARERVRKGARKGGGEGTRERAPEVLRLCAERPLTQRL
jgi:hypothetical protein